MVVAVVAVVAEAEVAVVAEAVAVAAAAMAAAVVAAVTAVVMTAAAAVEAAVMAMAVAEMETVEAAVDRRAPRVARALSRRRWPAPRRSPLAGLAAERNAPARRTDFAAGVKLAAVGTCAFCVRLPALACDAVPALVGVGI